VTSLLVQLWLMVASVVTVMPIDALPDGWANDYAQLVTADGRVSSAAVGCHAADDVRYYRRSFALHLQDVQREKPWLAFKVQVAMAHIRFVDTEEHELAHVVDCMDDGLLNGSPGHHDWTSNDAYCMSNDAERYACAVDATGRIK